jgi:hypothetical protein
LRVERESIAALSGAAVGNRLVLVGARVARGALWAKVHGEKRSFALSSPSIRSTFQQATLALRVVEDSSRFAVYQGEVDVKGRTLNGGEGLALMGMW